MPRTLTEPQAWREIARRIAEGQWDREGLCWEITGLLRRNAVGIGTGYRMRNRIWKHTQPRYGYYWPMGEPDVRVLAALFLALEAEGD